MTLQAMREKRAKIVANMEEVIQIAESDERVELNEEEAKMYAEYEQDLEQIKTAIARREKLENDKAALDNPEPSKVKSQAADYQGKGDRHVPGDHPKTEFDSLGEFMGAVVGHFRGKRDDARLSWTDNATPNAATQNMSDGASGGFLVPTKFRDTLLYVNPQEAIIESRSNQIEAGEPPDAEITMPALDQTGSDPDNVYGGVSVNWIGEGDTKPETDAKFREISLTPQELAAHIPVTDKLLRNAPAFSQQIETLMRQALIGAKERAYLSGNGVAKPMGIINANCTYTVNRADANQVAYEDVAEMAARLLRQGGQPYWLASQGVYSELVQLADSAGNIIWQPNAVEGSPGSLLGMPLFWHDRSPALGSVGDLALVNTNPYYLVKAGSGPFVSMGYIDKDFINNTTRVKCFLNVDAKPWLTEHYTLEGGYTASPFVILGDTE